MMDTYVTTALGLPRTLRDVGSDHLLPIAAEKLPSENDLSFFDNPPSLVMGTHAHAKLVIILGKIIEMNYPVTRPYYKSDGFYTIPYPNIVDIERQLDQWHKALGEISAVDRSDNEDFLRYVVSHGNTLLHFLMSRQ